MPISRTRLIFLYTLLCLIWGSTWVVIRFGNESALPPFFAVALRFCIATVILWCVVLAKKLPLPKGRSQWNAAIVNGVLSCATSYAIVYWASQYVDSGLDSVIFGLMPLWAIFIAHFARIERMSIRKFAGVVFGLAGVGLIFLPGIGRVEGTTIIAMAVMTLAPFASSISLLITKRYGREIEPISLNAVATLIASVLLSLLAYGTSSVQFNLVNWTNGWTIAYLSVFGTIIAFVTYYYLLIRMSAVTLSYITLITPVIAILLGWAIFNEQLTVYSIIGSAIVLLGTWLATNDRRVKQNGRSENTVVKTA